MLSAQFVALYKHCKPKPIIALDTLPLIHPTLKTKGRRFDDFVATDGTVSRPNENLRWQQSCQFDDILFFSELIDDMYKVYSFNKLHKFLSDLNALDNSIIAIQFLHMLLLDVKRYCCDDIHH